MNKILRSLCLLLLTAPELMAQEPAAVRKVVLPNQDSQVAARLIALERKLNPFYSLERSPAAALIAQLALPVAPLDTLTPILADPRNQDVWEQLPEEYYRMTQESGDALVTLTEPLPFLGVAWSSGQVRRLCHQRLASLPRASLELYRQRVDAEAKALLEQGRRARSPIPLRRLVDELFCSTPGDQALDLLGDLAFERGEFDEARHWWSLLTPLDDFRFDRLRFPHPQVDLACVQAKQILALIFLGRHDEAQAEIARFNSTQPKAKGKLAGQDDFYVAILQKTLGAFVKERISNHDEPWTTFGGDPSRNRPLSQPLSLNLWEDGPAWSVALPSLQREGNGKGTPSRSSLTRRAAFHPVIVNHQVLIADHRSVISYQLATGKELFRYDLNAAGLIDAGPGIDPKISVPRFTLSVDCERAYVRLGKLGMGPKKVAERGDASYLVCLDLTKPEVNKKRELWHVQASTEDKAVAFFEGAPLVHGGRVYIALSKVVSRHVLTSIECYDILGRHRWSREVCDCPEFEENGNGPRHRQHLLTLAGGQIFYCSHAGAIVAVDAWTGQPTWGVRYPSRGALTAEHSPSPRDLTPCLYADGLVFAAPVDSDRLFCFDAVTGLSRWEVEGIEIVHLLGVTQDRLFAATRDGVVSIQARTGQIDWAQPSDGRLPSFGRGLIAGRWLFWPTQDAEIPYRAVSLRTGEPPNFDPTRLHTLPVGNLAYGQGCLVIADLNELVVYAPAHKLRQLPPPELRPEARIDLRSRRSTNPSAANFPDFATWRLNNP